MSVLATQGIYRSDRARRVLRRTAEHETLGLKATTGHDVIAARKAIMPDRDDGGHRRKWSPSRPQRSSWYDKFADEVFNCMGNVFSRTSSINHEALILIQFSGTTSVNKSG